MHRHLAVPYALSAHDCRPLSSPLCVAYHALPFAMLCVLCATCGTLRDTSMINCLSQVTFDILSYLLCFGYPPSPSRFLSLCQLWLSKSLKWKFHSHCSATTTAISFSFTTKLTIKAFQLTLDMPLKLNALQSTSMRAVKVTNNVPLMLYDDQRRPRVVSPPSGFPD